MKSDQTPRMPLNSFGGGEVGALHRKKAKQGEKHESGKKCKALEHFKEVVNITIRRIVFFVGSPNRECGSGMVLPESDNDRPYKGKFNSNRLSCPHFNNGH